MKKKVVVHIGMGKTGSSFIQSSLARQASFLGEKGIHYPYHSSFDDACDNKISSGNGLLLLENSYQMPDDKSVLLYSSEILFMSLLEGYRIESLVDAVKEIGAKLVIFIHVRDFFELSFSSWGQGVKRGGQTCSYEELMSSGYGVMAFKLIVMWFDLAEKFQFEIRVQNYSRHKKSLYQDFMLDLFSDVLSANEINAYDSYAIVNRSLTLSEYELQRAFNIHYNASSSQFVSDFLVNSLPNVTSEYPKISKVFYEEMLVSIKPVVEEVNNRINNSFESVRVEDYEIFNVGGKAVGDGFYFSREQIHAFAKSLSNEIKKLQDEISCLGSEIKKEKQGGVSIKNDLGLVKEELFVDDEVVDSLRDMALLYEKENIRVALSLMSIAKFFRPTGPFINKKIDEYKRKVKS